MSQPLLPPFGELDAGVHRLPVRVYYEDTDFTGIVYHASYLRFFERGRTEFLRAVGIDQAILHAEDGRYFAVHRIEVRFRRPARMDDALIVETRAGAMKGAVLRLDQEIRRGDDVISTAEVDVVALAGGRPVRLPSLLHDRLSPQS